ncbi:HAD-IA family hydrolase [Micromonospora tulbaghiae]|uniref:HAD-IA family hydrolase n=1 Tax=Micromonospora tulbaghiae TaxID=479978 RepID=A0AAW4JHB1_9ACTN|nr:MULTISPECIES: HAD-IA family hydrolase [Micromonospora]KAB1907631.1 HAD-IA family hydrolase [Micromonospora sp. AMSO1212t]MBO4141228.1 HAD-IA family hydrolase [Micromonospora tulbaghiae]MDX5458157.1 HAD-IA family hydrolase [Micromonospora tulbaghiae]SCE83296.1 putative hydrolase of the HAD superfamily [Micromonospora tulbaghiae]
MSRERATALLVDFDGVLRRWDPAVAVGVEREYGLTEGVLGEIAMSWGLLQPVLTGQVSHAQWMTSVADALTPAVGVDRARAAVQEWQSYRGEVDPDVLAFVREVRAAGIRVGLGTNATDLLDADLAALGLTEELDVIVNSSVIGVHKPAKEYFQAACEALETPPGRVLFVDDEDRAVAGARVAGLSAHRWSGPADLRYLRAALAY